MENNKDKNRQNEERECAAETVHLKNGPWHEDKPDDTSHNTKGKTIEEATDPSKLSQL